jgi:hypothetical protein
MKQQFLLLFALASCSASFSQKVVQPLQATRLSIFKNGTYFIKKSATVNVQNQSFTIPAPTNVLMGSFWLATSKEATVKSIKINVDTFRVPHACQSMEDYLKASIGKTVTLVSTGANATSLTGILLDFNMQTNMFKMKTTDNKLVVGSSSFYNQFVMNDDNNRFQVDSVAPLASIKLNQNVGSTIASTLSLEKGIQWVPSYLLTILNDKEATLSLKATIMNNGESYFNTDMDIIIGKPELFYGDVLDPICANFLNQEIFNSRERNQYSYNLSNQVSGYAVDKSEKEEEGDGTDGGDKEGSKLEDLYIYKLGKIDLEKGAATIIPVSTATVKYEDLYTVDLPINSTQEDKANPIEVFHKYKIINSGSAPLTTGSVLVINQNDLPIAQSQIKYTPAKGEQEINISKAIDVQVRNEETEGKREKSNKKVSNGVLYDKVTYNGRVFLQNLQNKTIKVKVSKSATGFATATSVNGKVKKIKDEYASVNGLSLMEWEVELAAGQKLELTYSYYAFEN